MAGYSGHIHAERIMVLNAEVSQKAHNKAFPIGTVSAPMI